VGFKIDKKFIVFFCFKNYFSNCDMFMALKNAVDFLNAFRMVTNADNYYGGRDPLKAENSNVKKIFLKFFLIFRFSLFLIFLMESSCRCLL